MNLQIERIEVSRETRFTGERIVCLAEGKPFPEHKTTVYYKDKLTDHEYLYIIGAFSPPAFDMPGFVLVAGYDRHRDPETKARMIRILAEFEANGNDISSMVVGMGALYKRYGAVPLLSGWFCNVPELWSIKITEELVAQLMPFYLIPGPYWNTGGPAREYLRTLAQYMPLIRRGECNKLRGYMDRGPQSHEQALSFKPEKNPALMAVAVAVTIMAVEKPWLWTDHPMPIDPRAKQTGRYVVFGDEELMEAV